MDINKIDQLETETCALAEKVLVANGVFKKERDTKPLVTYNDYNHLGTLNSNLYVLIQRLTVLRGEVQIAMARYQAVEREAGR